MAEANLQRLGKQLHQNVSGAGTAKKNLAVSISNLDAVGRDSTGHFNRLPRTPIPIPETPTCFGEALQLSPR